MSGVGTSATTPIACTTHAGARSTTAIAGAIIVVAQVWFRVPLVDDKINWHFPFQTADITLAEIVTQFVHL